MDRKSMMRIPTYFSDNRKSKSGPADPNLKSVAIFAIDWNPTPAIENLKSEKLENGRGSSLSLSHSPSVGLWLRRSSRRKFRG